MQAIPFLVGLRDPLLPPVLYAFFPTPVSLRVPFQHQFLHASPREEGHNISILSSAQTELYQIKMLVELMQLKMGYL